ncbi:unnamed protein product [Ostreobium quekettii]|uniref:Protein kinase domain-containing protein n=1 Tax=Ostreobium quekettii TaxID=121088 RepID=A0A8S1IZI0_9CHLO|nr:unnamed protein product [Ostreobium quekettii]
MGKAPSSSSSKDPFSPRSPGRGPEAHVEAVEPVQGKKKTRYGGFLCFWGRLLSRRRNGGSQKGGNWHGKDHPRKLRTGGDDAQSCGHSKLHSPMAPSRSSLGMPSSRCSSGVPRLPHAEWDERPITEPTTPSDCVRQAVGSLELGPRLGGGNANVVYRGMLNSSPVAVRLIRHAKVYSAAYEPLEGYLQRHVHHPNLVRILGLRTRPQGGRRISTYRPSDVSIGDSVCSYLRRSTSSDVFSELARHLPAKRRSLSPEEEMETWVIMEYCDRGSLAQALQSGLCWTDVDPKFRIVNFRTVLCIALEIARAMTHLHACGIVHGDLKPENVLLQSKRRSNKGFTCKVGDFELSRLTNRVNILETFSIGTLSHQPPEMLQKGLLTPEADVFSFGMLLWELVAGQVPFKGKPPAVVQMSIVNGYRPRVPPSWPAWYAQLVRSCWSHDRRKRPEFSVIVQHLQLVLNNMKEAQRQSLDNFCSRKSSVEECEAYREAAQQDTQSYGKARVGIAQSSDGAADTISYQSLDVSIGSRIGGINPRLSTSSLRNSTDSATYNLKMSFERDSDSFSSGCASYNPSFQFGAPHICATMQPSAKLTPEPWGPPGPPRPADIFAPRPGRRSGSSSLDRGTLSPVEEERSARPSPRYHPNLPPSGQQTINHQDLIHQQSIKTPRGKRTGLSTVREAQHLPRAVAMDKMASPRLRRSVVRYPVPRLSGEGGGQRMEHSGTGESVPEEEYFWECRRFTRPSSSFDTVRSSGSSTVDQRRGATKARPLVVRVRADGAGARGTRQPVVVSHTSACLAGGDKVGEGMAGMAVPVVEKGEGGFAGKGVGGKQGRAEPIIVSAS